MVRFAKYGGRVHVRVNVAILKRTTVVLSPQFKITNRWVGYLSKEELRLAN